MKKLGSHTMVAVVFTHLIACATTPVHTGQLHREITDLRRLAEASSPEYKTIQFSSYDRHSNLPGGPGWFANSDGFGKKEIPGFAPDLPT